MEKKKLGLFNFTCCEGCTIVVVEALNLRYDQWTEKLSITNFRAIKKVQPIRKMDIAIVEGAIATKHEIKKLKEIRSKTKILVAFGSGACNGYPSNHRNNFSAKMKEVVAGDVKKMKLLETVEPLEKYVKVDAKIDGCPVNRDEVIKKMDELIG